MDGSNNDEASRKTSLSFISSIFRRTISFSENNTNEIDNLGRARDRKRSISESSADEFRKCEDESKDFNDIDDELPRRRSGSSFQESELSSGESSLSNSFNLSRLLFGSRNNQNILATQVVGSQSTSLQESECKNTENSSDKCTADVDNISNSSMQPSLLLSENVSQNDHINSKLLGAFLSRINNVAANFVDPTGKGDTGLVYTDDPVMDRILKRTESPKDN